MPSDDDTIPHASRRQQRNRHRRSWQRRLLIGVAAALLVGGAAYAITGPLRPGDDTAASRTRTGTTLPPPSTVPTAVDRACRTPLNPTAPLRLWIGGDSLAGSLGPSLGEITGKSGVVQPVVDSRVSSGLASPDFLSWPKQSAMDMFTYNPEVTVFIIGANDAENLPTGAEQDPQWRARYSALVEETLKVLIGNGRTVYWVGAPVMSDPAFSQRVKVVNNVFREVAANHPEVTYVDAFTLFSGPDGSFAATLPGGDGKAVRVRAQDGIHFTPEGGDLLATSVFESLDPLCRIMQQTVRGVVKTTIEAKGSSAVPGTRRSGSTGSTGSSPPTTNPRSEPTASPTTSPPSTSSDAPAGSAPPTTAGQRG